MTTAPNAASGPAAPIDALRAAAGRLDTLGSEPFDPAEHAERFDAVHDALVAVLAEIELTPEQA